VSNPSFLDVSYLFKRKLIDKLMSQFQVELSGLINDAGYKELKPEQQMLAISELTHWWSTWFQRIPDPAIESNNDFLSVESDVKSENYEMSPKEFNWYNYLLYLGRSQSAPPR
jgi:hypothetical protein